MNVTTLRNRNQRVFVVPDDSDIYLDFHGRSVICRSRDNSHVNFRPSSEKCGNQSFFLFSFFFFLLSVFILFQAVLHIFAVRYKNERIGTGIKSLKADAFQIDRG